MSIEDEVGPSSFLKRLAEEFNRLAGQTDGASVEKLRLSAWLDSRSDADGLSVLERQVLLHRKDVRESVLEDGAPNVFRLHLWIITYGAHELGLDSEILAGTIAEVLSLGKKDKGTMTYLENETDADNPAGQAVRAAGEFTRKSQAA